MMSLMKGVSYNIRVTTVTESVNASSTVLLTMIPGNDLTVWIYL